MREHGLDAEAFLTLPFANFAASMFAFDFLVSCVVFWIFVHQSRVPRRWMYVAMTLLVGLSFALPMFLRARAREARGTDRIRRHLRPEARHGHHHLLPSVPNSIMNSADESVLQFGAFHLAHGVELLYRGGDVVPLAPPAVRVLRYLIEHNDPRSLTVFISQPVNRSRSSTL